MSFILAVTATVKTPRKSRKRKAPTPSAKLQGHLKQREEEKQETSSDKKQETSSEKKQETSSAEAGKSSEQKSSEQKSSEQKSSEQEKSNEQKSREPKEIIITAIRIVRRY